MATKYVVATEDINPLKETKLSFYRLYGHNHPLFASQLKNPTEILECIYTDTKNKTK